MTELDRDSMRIMREQWKRSLLKSIAMLDESRTVADLLDVAHLVGTVGLEVTRTASYAVSDASQLKQEQNQRELNERRDSWHG